MAILKPSQVVLGTTVAIIEQQYDNPRRWEVHVRNRSLSTVRLTPEQAKELAEVLPALADECARLNEEAF